MAFNRFLNLRGQASVEYLLLLVVFFILLTQYVLALVDSSIFSLEDVNQLAQIKAAQKTLGQAIDFVGVSRSSIGRKVSVFLPAHSLIACRSFEGRLQVEWKSNIPIDGCSPVNQSNPDYSHCEERYQLRLGDPPAVLDCSQFGTLHPAGGGVPAYYFYPFQGTDSVKGTLVSFNVFYDPATNTIHVVNSTGG